MGGKRTFLIALVIVVILLVGSAAGFVREPLTNRGLRATNNLTKESLIKESFFENRQDIERKDAKDEYVSVIVMFDEKPIKKSMLKTKFIIDKRLFERAEIKELVSDAIITKEYHIFDGVNVKINKKDLEKLNKIEGAKVFPSYKLRLPLADSVPQIHAPEVWAQGYTGSGIKVAVIDTGVDFTHPALSSRQADCRHWLNNGADVGLGCDDWYGHGTHVTGIIASTDYTYKGVSSGAMIMGLQVCDSTGVCYDNDAVSAIEYAVDNGADVISISLGASVDPNDPTCGDPSGSVLCYCYQTPMSTAVDNAFDAGVVVFAAAGNDGTDYYMNAPACADDAIAVGAVDVVDDVAGFSNRGPDLEIVAPGVDVISTMPASSTLVTMGYCDSSGWCSLDGTSMATPHASGAAALLLSINPSLTPAQIRTLLELTADDLAPAGRDDISGYGRINVYNAYLATFPSPKNVTVNTYKDSSYTKQTKFFDSGNNIFVEADIKDLLGRNITDAIVVAYFYNNDVFENSVVLDSVGNGVYKSSYLPLSSGVYNLSVEATNSKGSASTSTQIHVYPGSGVSAYIIDLGSNDYVMENQHLVVGFDTKQTNSTIIYLKQKDTDYDFDFSQSSDASSTNRMGLSNGTAPLLMNIGGYKLGENLSFATINYEPITFGATTYEPPLNDADKTCSMQWGNCNGCAGHTIDACGACNTFCYSYITEVTTDKTVYAPGGTITVTANFYCAFDAALLDVAFIAYNDGSGWKQKKYKFCMDGDIIDTVTSTFTLTGNSGAQNVRAGIQMGLGAGQTCAGDCSSGNEVGGDNDDVTITVAGLAREEIKTADLNITLRDEDDDFLLYTLYNFTSNFPRIFSSDITGNFDSGNDDRYHVGETDGLVISLPTSWQTYTPTHKYVSQYDADSADSVDFNNLGIVYFDSTPAIGFSNFSLKKGSLNSKVSYSATSLASTDKVEYLFVFSLGNSSTIGDWMTDIENKIFPFPNFLFKAKCSNGAVKSCSKQQGVCAGSNQTCTNDMWPGCSVNEYNYTGKYEIVETSCDGLDNDCDGTSDEGCTSLQDNDNDGVIDLWDICPNTPTESYVSNKGCPLDIQVTMPSGWNLIGYIAPESKDVEDALKNVNDTFDILWGYNASDAGNEWKLYDKSQPPELNTLKKLNPAFGYWVNILTNTIWRFNGNTIVKG